MAPGPVTERDVVELDLDGNLADPSQGAQRFRERFIHGEIYRRRPDVQAVVHSHALPVMPFAVVPGARLQPICHMCGFLAGTPAPFDVATHDGSATDLLIRNKDRKSVVKGKSVSVRVDLGGRRFIKKKKKKQK